MIFVFNNSIGKVGLVETDFGLLKSQDKQDGIRLACSSKLKLRKLLRIEYLLNY
jgi:hypothetical protein